jgi:transcriptional regulator with XRE-family HTH domain
MTEKAKTGRPPYKPTDETRKQVEALVGYGITEEQICQMIGISRPTLIKYYREEIDTGTAKANAKVAQSLYQKATGDGASAVTAAIFWLKTRAGWKETIVNENVGKDGGPIQVEDTSATEQFISRITSIRARAGIPEDPKKLN